MAKKNVTIEEPIEEVAIEATEPTVEPVNWFANGYPSRDFINPLPQIITGETVVTAEENNATLNGGQEEA
jgi:hypothetical protein